MDNKISINFHNIIGLEVISVSETINNFYLNEYKTYIVKDIKDNLPRITLNLALKPYPKTRKDLISASHKFIAKWNYEIGFFSNYIQIDAYSNYFGLFMLHHMVVHPSIRYLAAQKNILMLHAGAVTKNGKSIIIAGKGGVGKTTTTSQLLFDDREVLPHADDYVFLNNLDQSLAYLTRSHLYSDLLKRIPNLSKRLKLIEKIGIHVFSSIRKLSMNGIKWPTRISQDRLWPEKSFDMSAQIRAIIYLSRKNIDRPSLIQTDDIHDFANKLLEMNFSEAGHFLNLVRNQEGEDFLNRFTSEWRRKENKMLVDRLKNISHYYLLVPDTIHNPLEIRQEVNQLVNPLLS